MIFSGGMPVKKAVPYGMVYSTAACGNAGRKMEVFI